MSSADFLNRKYLSIKNKPFSLLIKIFLVYGIIWALLEPFMAIVPSINVSFSGWSRFLILILISFVLGILLVERPREFKFDLQSSTIQVIFGDLFEQMGIKTIPISQFMHEKDVVKTSLQGSVIQKFVADYEGDLGFSKYENALKDALRNEHGENITRFQEKGTEKFYPLGTAALIEHKNESYLFFAVTKTELKGHIPSDNCNTIELWNALREMWNAARIHSRGKDVNIPLIGSGMTGINLPPIRILELNLLALTSAIVEDGQITPGTIRIVIHPSLFEQIDLEEVKNLWTL